MVSRLTTAAFLIATCWRSPMAPDCREILRKRVGLALLLCFLLPFRSPCATAEVPSRAPNPDSGAWPASAQAETAVSSVGLARTTGFCDFTYLSSRHEDQDLRRCVIAFQGEAVRGSARSIQATIDDWRRSRCPQELYADTAALQRPGDRVGIPLDIGHIGCKIRNGQESAEFTYDLLFVPMPIAADFLGN